MTVVHRVTVTEEDFDGADPPPSATENAPPVPSSPPVKLTASWRQVVERKRLMLAMELSEVDDADTRAAISSLLAVADDAARTGMGLRKWWWGTEVERAWSSLREAEQQLFKHGRGGTAVDIDPEVLAQATRHLGEKDPRRVALEKAGEASTATLTAKDIERRRTIQLAALRAAHAASDRKNQEARYLRNRLLVATIFSSVCILVLLLVQWRVPRNTFITPPAEWTGSSWVLLGLVVLFGAVGSLVTAIPAVAAIPSDFTPFNLPLQQALLKVVVGPLTAVIGLLIVSSGLVVVEYADTFLGLLVLAVILGAGQQAVTRFVDSRASEILEPADPATE
jgi:hypothetical protein